MRRHDKRGQPWSCCLVLVFTTQVLTVRFSMSSDEWSSQACVSCGVVKFCKLVKVSSKGEKESHYRCRDCVKQLTGVELDVPMEAVSTGPVQLVMVDGSKETFLCLGREWKKEPMVFVHHKYGCTGQGYGCSQEFRPRLRALLHTEHVPDGCVLEYS